MNTPLHPKPRGPISQRVSEDGQCQVTIGTIFGLLAGFFLGWAFHIVISR